MTKIDESTEKVISLINELSVKDYDIEERISYNNMTATLSDAVLQAGVNYKSIVMPRINNILKKYREYTTTCDFIILFQTIPIEEIIKWKNKKKQNTLCKLAWLLYREGVSNEADLGQWLDDFRNQELLTKIKGIGYKTIDYLKLLSGQQAIPIDRHLMNFLLKADVNVNNYKEANSIFINVANQLKISERRLDGILWSYMSSTAIKT